VAEASKKQACAAKSFADTAALINSGIGDAVKKLDAQAKTAADSIQATHKAMRLDQRAWVGLSKVETIGASGGAEGQPFSFEQVQIRTCNSGKTPALDVASIAFPIIRQQGAPIGDYDFESALLLAENIRQTEKLREQLTSEMTRRFPQYAEGILEEAKEDGALQNMVMTKLITAEDHGVLAPNVCPDLIFHWPYEHIQALYGNVQDPVNYILMKIT
jgi:uncharacterized protein YecT (DUF1311 family)